MGIRCLGAVSIESDKFAEWVAEELCKANQEENPSKPALPTMYLKLGTKRYVPIMDNHEIDNSKDACENALERSRQKPQPVGEVDKGLSSYASDLYVKCVKETMLNRLWLYHGKIYELDRNDFNQEKVHLLILEFLDKEEKKFETLRRVFKGEV